MNLIFWTRANIHNGCCTKIQFFLATLVRFLLAVVFCHQDILRMLAEIAEHAV